MCREDVLQANNLTVPSTWDELLTAAAVVHGQDMDGDGLPDAAMCLMRMPSECLHVRIASLRAWGLAGQLGSLALGRKPAATCAREV